jgi:hypothetical protein
MEGLTVLQSLPAGLPISAYVLCLFPLIVVILGFIVAARFTDKQATSTYLRFLPRDASDSSVSQPLAAAKPAATPMVDDSAEISNIARGTPVAPAIAETLSGATAAEEPLKKSDSASSMADIAPATPTATPMSAPVASAMGITYIEFDPPGRDIDGEYVLIRNSTAAAVNMTGWKLIDGGAKHTFDFPAFTLAAGAEVKLWSKAGANDGENLYWGWRSAIWNNTGDTAQLSDAHGTLVSTYSYQGNG